MSTATLTRVDAVRIMRAGARAKVATDCPYQAAGDATERLRVAAWMRGYISTHQD